MVLTNPNEGFIFVNQGLGNKIDVAEYVSSVYPKLSDEQVASVVAAYDGLGSAADQMTMIYGDSTWSLFL